MDSPKQFLLIVSLVILINVVSTSSYDFYVLATKWQGTACQLQQCIKSEIDKVSKQQFNLHGLWPSSSSGKSPQNCKNSNVQLNKLSTDVTQELSQFWSGLYGSQEVFLSHEWTKHGSCWAEKEFNNLTNYSELELSEQDSDNEDLELRARKHQQKHKPQQQKPRKDDHHHEGQAPSAQDIKEQEAYFRVSMGSSKKYNIYTILQRANILPQTSKPYPYSQIASVISDGLRIRSALLICQQKSGKQFIEEIRMCLNLKLEISECLSPLSSGKECKRDMPIYYPQLETSSKSFLA